MNTFSRLVTEPHFPDGTVVFPVWAQVQAYGMSYLQPAPWRGLGTKDFQKKTPHEPEPHSDV